MKNKIIILSILAVVCFTPFLETVSALSNTDLTFKNEGIEILDSSDQIENVENMEEEVVGNETNEENLKEEVAGNEIIENSTEIEKSEKLNNEEKGVNSEKVPTAKKEISDYPESVKSKNIMVEAFGRGNPNTILEQEQRNMTHSSFETTGIYLPRGEELIIFVDGEVDPNNLSVVIGLYGVYDPEKFDLEQEKPEMVWTTLVKGENRISRPDASGLVYIENRNDSGSIHVKIDGGLKIPRFKLGVNSRESFIEEIENYSPYVPFFELEGNYTLSAFQVHQLEYLSYKESGRLESLVSNWDEVIIQTNEFYGFSSEAGSVAKKNTNQRVYLANPDTGVGYAYATTGYISFQVDTSASKDILEILPSENQWGLWHEVGHTYQNKNYTFENHTEVTVNLSANAINKNLLNESRLTGSKTNIKNYLNQPIENRVYTEIDDGFIQLGMFWTLHRVFGDTFFQRVNQNYRSMDSNQLPSTNEEKYQLFIKTTSEVTQRNLTQYFREWGIPVNEDTDAFCSQFSSLEKEIWKDIDGFDERFELLDILGNYTVPKGIPYTIETPVFTAKENIDIGNLSSVPQDSITTVQSTHYNDIGENKGTITLINEEGVRNKSIITTVTGGDAVRFFGNSAGIQIIAPNPETKKFQVTGKSGIFHAGFNSEVYASIILYNSDGDIKNESIIKGNENSNGINENFDNHPYEIGDIVEIYHVESITRLSRYKDNKLLEKDANKKYWYKMTEKGWEEINGNPTATFIEGKTYTLTSAVKANDLVKDLKGLYSNSEVTVRFESEPVLMELGEIEVSIYVDDSLAGETKIKGTIEVVGGDAVRFFGNYTGIQVIAPNPETKKFQVVGRSGNFHGSWGDGLYASIILYSPDGKVKRETLINGNENSIGIKENFDNQPYEIGDIVEIFHAESNDRLFRYKENILIERDSNKKYWYKMTEKGWVEIDGNPTATFIEGKSFTVTSIVKAEDLVKDVKGLYPNSEVTVKFESEPVLMDLGEKEVIMIVEDNLGGQLKIKGTIEVVAGDSVRFFGNSTGVQVIVPNPETKKFQVVGKSGNFHGSWGAGLYASIILYTSDGKIKKETLINGNENSIGIKDEFDNQPYEIGDIVQIYHAEATNRLFRYKENILLDNNNNKYYRYEMTNEGWEPIEIQSEFEFVFNGDEENATATVVKYNGSKTDIEIPEVAINFVDGWFEETPVVAIGDAAFSGKNFTSVRIPGSVKKIGDEAFRRISNLTTLHLSEGLEEIGMSAFDNTNVSEMNLPKSLKKIDDGAFWAANLTEVTIPENVEIIGSNAFRANGPFSKVTILSDKVSYSAEVFSNSQVEVIYTPRDKLETIKGQLTSTVMNGMKDNNTHLRAIEDYKEDERIINKDEKEEMSIEVTDEYRFDTKNALRWTLDTPEQQINWYKDDKLIENGIGMSAFTIEEMSKADAGTYYAERDNRILDSIYVTVDQRGLIIPPLNPTNSENLNIPSEEMNPQADNLAILFVSPLVFESTQRKNSEQIVYGTTEEKETPIITIQDFRNDEERVGWELYIRQTTNFYDGAELQMNPYIHESYRDSLKLTTGTDNIILGTENQQFAKTTVANPPSGVVTIGMSHPDKNGVSLIIPKGSGTGEYKTNIVWELVSSP